MIRMRFTALRDPRTGARLARVLWIIWAVLAWNVVFDHVIATTARRYVAAAARAASAPQPRYENMDDWMRPAVTRGFWIAGATALLIAGSGLVLVRAAARPHTYR
jgi:hypothetical protein